MMLDRKLRVLLVENEASPAESVARGLRDTNGPTDVAVVSGLADAIDALRRSPPHVVIAHWPLPEGGGERLVAELDDVGCPLIVLTSPDDEQGAVDAINAGAVEWVAKSSAMADEIPIVVKRALRHWESLAERRRVERTVREREEHFRSLVENIRDLITEIDEDGTIRYVSPSIERVLGYRPVDRIGRTVLELIHPDDLETARESMRRAFAAPGTTECEVYRLQHRDGSWRVVEAFGTAHRTRDEELRGVINSRDITDQLEAERERTRLEDELRRSQRLEAIGQLAGGIAHDFNNLLTIIGGHADLIELEQEMGKPARWRERLREIRTAQASAAALTRQLLAFGRRQVLQPVVLDVNQVVREVERMVHRVLGEHIDLTLSLHGGPVWVEADPGQIEQIVVNLLVNARDAMPDGGPVTVRTEPLRVDAEERFGGARLGRGDYVVLAVSDAGLGMSDDVKQRIFDPFFTTKPRGRGTGLGLSTVFGIVKQSGGEIGVESRAGKGTTFRIFLPAVAAPAEETLTDPDAKRPIGGAETILIAEDDHPLRLLLCQVLGALGYTVLEARHADEALRVQNEFAGPIHLLLTDVIMPGRNGWQLAEEFRQARPDAQVLFMSGYADDSVGTDQVVDPSVQLLPKPFTPAVLGHRVRQILSRRPSSGSVTTS